jgi:hypothetical protein
MKLRAALISLVVVVLATNMVFADDGPLFKRNISGTPLRETGGAQISIMPLYVPAQNTQGELVEIAYLVGDDKDTSTTAYTRTEAKPLVSTYIDGMIDEELPSGGMSINTGAGFGERDAFASLSLDDGTTWKNWNLSDSALRSSFVLRNGHAYPGDVFRINHVVEGNRVAVAWISRFCESGAPLYSWAEEDQLLLASTYELGANLTVEGVEYNTYASDLFGVAGSQGSVDYTLQGFPEVGEIPYGCVWVARGTLEEVDLDGNLSPGSGIYDIKWRASERLTSGRRDANRIDITGTGGAGFIVSWQEDPDGLRPGKGLGPGEGWSGAIANSKTDIWYTYIAWDHFDDVCLDDPDTGLCTAGLLAEFTDETKPKSAVPFAVPMRLTDNNQCKPIGDAGQLLSDPYCYADFDGNGTPDLCATETTFTNGAGESVTVCVAEDGRPLTGRTASTRVRWALKPYTNADGETSAWVVMAEEKMKAMGTEAEGCDPVTDPDCEPIDIGKDMWYHTFEWNNPELVQQGLMLNAPAIDHETGLPFDIYYDEWGYAYHQTEIARRFNLMVQGIGAAMASESQTAAILIYKEGILFQGGPADIFIRRVVLPDGFEPTADNPFAYENVQCVEFDDAGNATAVAPLYSDGSNPNYVRGLCPVQGMNVSGTTIVTCDDGSSGDTCAASFPWDPTVDESGYPKVTEWVQTPANFNDASWANPYDVSKGHRGFIDGDFVMMMYATAPNWKANTTGNEAYNLYVRRSFDGGQTWTTTPADLGGVGTETCENYGWGGQVEEPTCTPYGPGEFEQARNVSQLVGSRVTVLDPRYTPTGGMLKTDYSSLLCYDGTAGDWVSCSYDEASAPYPEEIRDPSVYFVTYETGDNTVVTVETGAVPMDMYYSRAYNWGDDYDVVDICGEDYPGSPATCVEGETIQRWDWLENGEELATEASVTANPDGSRFYTVWNQEVEIAYEVFADMDVEYRRIFYDLVTDAVPTASIIYQSHTSVSQENGDTLLLVGTAEDHDHVGDGIVAYLWHSNLDGDLSYDPTLSIPASSLSVGRHTITFSAQDGEGNWSGESISLLVAQRLYNFYLPVVKR